MSLLDLEDAELKGLKNLIRNKHFPGNFHAVPWTVPSQRKTGDTVGHR